MTGEELAQVAMAAKAKGALVAVDVLHPGRPRDFKRLAPLLAITDWFLPNGDRLRALTARDELGPAVKDGLALGTGGVAVTLGADGCLVIPLAGYAYQWSARLVNPSYGWFVGFAGLLYMAVGGGAIMLEVASPLLLSEFNVNNPSPHLVLTVAIILMLYRDHA